MKWKPSSPWRNIKSSVMFLTSSNNSDLSDIVSLGLFHDFVWIDRKCMCSKVDVFSITFPSIDLISTTVCEMDMSEFLLL